MTIMYFQLLYSSIPPHLNPTPTEPPTYELCVTGLSVIGFMRLASSLCCFSFGVIFLKIS